MQTTFPGKLLSSLWSPPGNWITNSGAGRGTGGVTAIRTGAISRLAAAIGKRRIGILLFLVYRTRRQAFHNVHAVAGHLDLEAAAVAAPTQAIGGLSGKLGCLPFLS